LNLARNLRTGYHGPWWTEEELALLGTLPDDEVAARVGRTANAVRIKRTLRGIPTALDKRQDRKARRRPCCRCRTARGLRGGQVPS